MANVVPDRSGDPRRGNFYNLAVNRPGAGARGWQVDAWDKSGENHLGQHTFYGYSREDAVSSAHQRMAENGRLTHDVEPQYRKKFRKSKSYLG